jgi:hypothetical protein
MQLRDLVSEHQQVFTQKVVQILAAKHELSVENVLKRYDEVITRYVQGKYQGVERAVSRILECKRPVVVSIRRDPCSEDVCIICERDMPNIRELQQLYGDRIAFIDFYDSSPEGALYHIINRSSEGEKLLPLTAIVQNGEVLKYWSGRPVEVKEYREYLESGV